MSLPKDGDELGGTAATGGGGERPKEGSREISDGIIVSEVMDWCKSPTAIVGYTIWAKQADAGNLANSVRLTDDRAHVKESLVLECHGDEPGVGGGVLSGTHNAECEPLTYSPTVRAEGRNMVRHDDLWWMNHKNTYGRLTYVKDPTSYPTPDPQLVDAKMQLALYQDPNAATDAPAPGSSTLGAQPSPTALSPSPEVPQTAPGTPWTPSIPLDPAGPGAMELMGHVDRWLQDNVNEPEDWWSKGLLIKRKPQPPVDPSAPHVPLSGDVRSTGDQSPKKCKCLTGAYSKIKNRCGPECGSTYQAHHIVPDYTLRYGTRSQGEAGQKRIPGLPSFGDGPAICLEGQAADAGSEHGLAHGADAEVLKAGSTSVIQGTADLNSILRISARYANSATNGQCVAEIRGALAQQPSLNSDILGRTTLDPPNPDVPSDRAAYDALSSGMRATHH